MRSAVAISVDGVLRRDIGYAPIPEGILLYRTLAPVYNIILLASWDVPGYTAGLEHFLQTEQLREHSKVIYEGDRLDQVTHLRNTGMQLDFVVEADPAYSENLFAYGFNVMHFMHAQYTRPQWRPDFQAEITPWDALVQQETEIKGAKEADKRMDR